MKERRPSSNLFRPRHAFLLAVALATASPAPAQHRAPAPDPAKIPASLRLKGDPAASIDFGSMRAAPAPARPAPDGPVIWFGGSCRSCVAAGAAIVSPAAPSPEQRILGMPRDAAEAWIERISGARPEIVSTRRSVLVYVAKAKTVEPASSDESARLRVFFPKLPSDASSFDPHAAAHLWAERLGALEAEVSGLLDLDEEGRLRAPPGPYAPAPFDRAEIFVFADAAAAATFEEFVLGASQGARPEGLVFKNRPIAWVNLDHATPAVRRRRFAFAAASALVRATARDERAIPPWLRVGVAYLFEHRAAERSPRFDDADALTIPADSFDSDVKPPKDRASFLRAMADEGRAPRLDALASTDADGLAIRSRVASWGLVRFLVGVDRAKFAKLVAATAATQPSSDRLRPFIDAFKAVYGEDESALDNAWRFFAADGR